MCNVKEIRKEHVEIFTRLILAFVKKIKKDSELQKKQETIDSLINQVKGGGEISKKNFIKAINDCSKEIE